MSPGMSTFIVLAVWATPIAIGLILMRTYYRSPTEAELAKQDEVQPD
jgi:NADH:ubiquinone oxidoreductase subunit K